MRRKLLTQPWPALRAGWRSRVAQTALESLEVARRHLPRVQVAGYPPVDWADLSLYGFF